MLTEISKLVIGKSNGVVASCINELIFGQVSVLHVIHVEKYILAIIVPNQETVVIILIEEFQGSSYLHHVWINCLNILDLLGLDLSSARNALNVINSNERARAISRHVVIRILSHERTDLWMTLK